MNIALAREKIREIAQRVSSDNQEDWDYTEIQLLAMAADEALGPVDNAEVKKRLEYLRGELRAERISWCELAELQSLVPYMDGDSELLEAAGVPEHGPSLSGIKTKHVCQVDVIDPDTKMPVAVEIRKLETGGMVGLDGSYLEHMTDEDLYSPYDSGEILIIPDDE